MMADNIVSFKMFLANCTGNAQNNTYRNAVTINSVEELATACRKDHVCASFEEFHRGNNHYIRGYAFAADCDNDFTEDPAAWITPATVAERLPGVAFYAVKSRNCDKVKHPGERGVKSARPRYHYYFPLQVPVEGYQAARNLADMFLAVFPMFDDDGTKPAQFFFGHAEPVAEYFPGEIDIREYFRENPIEMESEPDIDPEPAARAMSVSEDFTALNVHDMLSYVSASCTYGTWVKIGMAIKAAGLPFEVWDDWSKTAPDMYPGIEKTRRKWLSFKGGKISFGTLVYMATENGWTINPEKLTGEAKTNHEAAEARKMEYRQFREKHREEHRAHLATVGINTDDPYKYTWKNNQDGSIAEVIEKESGEIVYKAPSAPADNTAEVIQGITVKQAVQIAPEAAAPADPSAPWEHIIKSESLPRFPLEIFPGWIKEYIDNVAENTGINKDFCAACVIGAVSTIVCGHMDIHFNGTHYEPGQLYTVFVGRSGSMKSTGIKQFVGPARAWLMERNKEVKSINESITAEIDMLAGELTTEQRKKTGQDEKQIEELKARIQHKRETMKNHYPVPFTDVVPESIIRSMTETKGTATIATAEGNIINVLTGKSYNQRGASPNLDIFLAGHDGEPYHGIRVTSGEIEIPRVDISILMAIQPTLLDTLCSSSDANGRGLVQRFLVFAPDEPEQDIDHTKTSTIDSNHALRWSQHIRTIAERFMRPDDTPITIELYKDADYVIRQLWNYEAELIRKRGPADEEGITGWISKMHGKALRLAAILSVLDEPKANSITKEHAETAAYLLREYFLPHYIGSYEMAENVTKEEKKIIGWITRRAEITGNQGTFTERELKQNFRHNPYFSGRFAQDHIRSALDGLQDKNYIRPQATEKPANKPGPVAKTWQINPELFK